MLASTTSTCGTRASAAAAAAASRVATAAATTTTTTMTRCHASPTRHAARRPADHDVGHFQREPLRLDPNAPLWVFGYGSIVWKTGFEYEERRVCVARGWRRRFYQVRDETRRSLSIIVWHSIRCLHHADRRRRAPQPQPNARYSTVYHPYSFITGLHGSQRHAGVPRQDGHARGVRGRRPMLGRRVQDLPERRPRGSRSFRDPGKAVRSADLSSPPRRRLGRRPRRRRERADVRRDGAREQPELAGTRAGR